MYIFYANTGGCSCYAGKYHFIAKDREQAIELAKEFELKHNQMIDKLSNEKYGKHYSTQHTIKFNLDKNYFMNSSFELPEEGIVHGLTPTGTYEHKEVL